MKDDPFDHNLYYNYPKSLELNSKYYWSRIDKFLKLLKKETGITTLIAAAHRRKKDDLPINQKFIFNKTAHLIKDAKLVISHSSTAVLLAVLFKKPIILLNIKEFKKKQTSILNIKNFQKLLGCNIINLEQTLTINKFSLEKNLNIDENKYNKFIDYYLRFKEVKETDLWDKIINKLKKK